MHHPQEDRLYVHRDGDSLRRDEQVKWVEIYLRILDWEFLFHIPFALLSILSSLTLIVTSHL